MKMLPEALRTISENKRYLSLRFFFQELRCSFEILNEKLVVLQTQLILYVGTFYILSCAPTHPPTPFPPPTPNPPFSFTSVCTT